MKKQIKNQEINEKITIQGKIKIKKIQNYHINRTNI